MKIHKIIPLIIFAVAFALISTPLLAREEEQIIDRQEMLDMLRAEVSLKICDMVDENTWLNDNNFSYLRDNNVWYFDNLTDLKTDHRSRGNQYKTVSLDDIIELSRNLKNGGLPVSQVRDPNKQFDVMTYFLTDNEMLNILFEGGFNPRITLEQQNYHDRNILTQCVLNPYCDIDTVISYIPGEYAENELYNALYFFMKYDEDFYPVDELNKDLEDYSQKLEQAREALALSQGGNPELIEEIEANINGLEEAIQYCRKVLASYQEIDEYYKNHKANSLSLVNEVISRNIYGFEKAYQSLSKRNRLSELTEALKYLRRYVNC